PSDGTARACRPDRPRHVPRDRRGASPRARRRQVPAVPAAPPVRRGRLARSQDAARLLRVRRPGPKEMTFETLKIGTDGPLAVVIISREPQLNALSSTVMR